MPLLPVTGFPVRLTSKSVSVPSSATSKLETELSPAVNHKQKALVWRQEDTICALDKEAGGRRTVVESPGARPAGRCPVGFGKTSIACPQKVDHSVVDRTRLDIEMAALCLSWHGIPFPSVSPEHVRRRLEDVPTR